MRTKDLTLLRKTVAECDIKGLNPEEWIKINSNVMMVDVSGNIALFEYYRPQTYAIHLCMKQRGKEALDSALKLKEYFLKEFDAKFLTGLIREDNKKAIWFAKQLGSTSYGTIETDTGPCQFMIFTV